MRSLQFPRVQRTSQGDGCPDSDVVSPSTSAADDDDSDAPMDAADVEELLDTLSTLQLEFASTQKRLKHFERMASAYQAKCGEYEEMVTALERTQRMLREHSDREMAVRVRSACEITRMEMYRRAEAGSVMELLGRCEKDRRLAELQKLLDAQPAHGEALHRPASVVDQGVQASSKCSHCEGANSLPCKDTDGAERRSLEPLQEELSREADARRRAEDAAQEALSQLASASQELAAALASKEELEQRLADAQQENGRALELDEEEARKEADEAKEALEVRARLGVVEEELRACREELSQSKEAHRAALLQLESTQKELAQLKSSGQSSLAQKEEGQSEAGDENCPPRTRRATRTTEARRTRAVAASSEAFDDDDDFKMPRRTARLPKKPATLADEAQETAPGHRSVLGESNAESSPPPLISEMVSRAYARFPKPSAAGQRKPRLLATDKMDFVELDDDED